MRPDLVLESFAEREARLVAATDRARIVKDVRPHPVRLLVGRALVGAGTRLLPPVDHHVADARVRLP
ncbi:MAG: hypothetical protein M3198_08965 [Actinomycetota bacterium]|nr:hypothetical protein [Actinomycetota bacterium]